MNRNEKLVLIRDVPAAIIEALDGVMATQSLLRIVTREMEEDWSPLLSEAGGPTVFVLSQPSNDWTACFSSLAPTDEWQLAEALALSLEQPTIYALLSDDTNTYVYRYFADGELHEEFIPDDNETALLDAASLLNRLEAHGVPLELLDDRTVNFGAEHVLVGYRREHDLRASSQNGVAELEVEDTAEDDVY